MRRNQILLALAVYVVPVAVAAVLLAMADLAILSVALVVIEVVVASAAYAARRRPDEPPTPARGPASTKTVWLVPAAMLSALLLMVAIAVLGSRAG